MGKARDEMAGSEKWAEIVDGWSLSILIIKSDMNNNEMMSALYMWMLVKKELF